MTYPAIRIRNAADSDLVAALVDDFSPTAIEPRDTDVRVFFASARDRDAAHRTLSANLDVEAIDVPDNDWARRSQADLEPITIGRVTVFPRPQEKGAVPLFHQNA